MTGLAAANKAYDGTTDATLDTSGVVLEGAVPGDDVTLDVSGATATFDTKDVGTGITVTVSGLALAGADAGNYIADHANVPDSGHHSGRALGEWDHGLGQDVRRHDGRDDRHERCDTHRCGAW